MEQKRKRYGKKAYTRDMPQKLLEYFDRQPVSQGTKCSYYSDGTLKSEEPVFTAGIFPTFEGFAAKEGISCQTIDFWRKKHGEFAQAVETARNMQKNIWAANGMSGEYNSAFAQFYAKTFWDTEKEDTIQELVIKIEDV